MSHQLLNGDDCKYKTYYTTDDDESPLALGRSSRDIPVKLMTESNDGCFGVKLGTTGKYKIVLGCYFYKEEDDLEEEDNIEDVNYVPDADKHEWPDGTVVYKVSGYKVFSRVLEGKGDTFSIYCNQGTGYPGNIDIIVLKKID